MVIFGDFSDIPFEDPEYKQRWQLRPANEWNLNLEPGVNVDVLADPAVPWAGPEVEVEVRCVFEWTSGEGFDTQSTVFYNPTEIILGGVRTTHNRTALSQPFFAGHKYPTQWRMFARWVDGECSLGLILEVSHQAITARNISMYILRGKERRSKCYHRRFGEMTFPISQLTPLFRGCTLQGQPMCLRCVMTIPEMEKTAYCVTNDIISLSKDLLWLLVSGKDSDGVIFLDAGACLPIHKNILRVRSTVFERNFRRKDILVFKVKLPVMYELLRYMYSGQVYYSCPHLMKKLKVLAISFQMRELENTIMEYLKHVTPENPTVCEVCDPEGVHRPRESMTEQEQREARNSAMRRLLHGDIQ